MTTAAAVRHASRSRSAARTCSSTSARRRTSPAAPPWITTGNLIGSTDARFDLTQLGGPLHDVCRLSLASAPADHGDPARRRRRLVAAGQGADGPRPQGDDQRPDVEAREPDARVNPAKLCKAERTRLGVAAFNELWGTNGNDKNAFGKCVSTMAQRRTPARRSSRSWLRSRPARQGARAPHRCVRRRKGPRHRDEDGSAGARENKRQEGQGQAER